MSDFLQLTGKTILVMGVANKRSIAWHIAKTLEENGAKVLYTLRSEARRQSTAKLLAGKPTYICDVEQPGAAQTLARQVAADHPAPLHGIVHSIAFANYAAGIKPFHETPRADYLQATTISAFSLVEIVNALKPQLAPDASIVTLGISSLIVTPDNYGYMGPIKAALESTARFLAKSLSADTQIRVNTLGAGPLLTSASAGIPGYLESYLYAEKMTLRKKNITAQEVANAALFLLSPRSSAINATTLTIDAGLGGNYFDAEIIRQTMRTEQKN